MGAKEDFSNYTKSSDQGIAYYYSLGNKEIQVKSNDPKKQGTDSLFNGYTQMFYPGSLGNGNSAISYFDQENDYKTGSGANGAAEVQNPSINTIINHSKQFKAMNYDWTDFLYCKHQGYIPNNYLVTLRRFGSPVEDNLLQEALTPGPDIGRMITWMDGEENKLDDILSFSYGVNWRELKSEIQKLEATGHGGNISSSSMFGKLISTTDPSGRVANRNLQGEEAANFDAVGSYKNRILGPIDVIDKMMVRDVGLNFENNITLNFKYELQSYDGVNPKIAMLDLLSNILLITYNRGEFWGGDRRFAGAGPKLKPLGDVSRLTSGDFAGYLSSMVGDIGGKLSALTGGKGFTPGGIGDAVKAIGSNMMSSLIGGQMNKIGRPQVQAMVALLTGEATGEYHLTIGNPLNPIAMMGNLIIEDTNLSFEGPLGRDDFPRFMNVECKLKHARPRDKWDMENMFSGNNGRMYFSNTKLINTNYAMNVPYPNSKSGGNAGKNQSQKGEEQMENLISLGENVTTRFPNSSIGDVTQKMNWTQ